MTTELSPTDELLQLHRVLADAQMDLDSGVITPEDFQAVFQIVRRRQEAHDLVYHIDHWFFALPSVYADEYPSEQTIEEARSVSTALEKRLDALDREQLVWAVIYRDWTLRPVGRPPRPLRVWHPGDKYRKPQDSSLWALVRYLTLLLDEKLAFFGFFTRQRREYLERIARRKR